MNKQTVVMTARRMIVIGLLCAAIGLMAIFGLDTFAYKPAIVSDEGAMIVIPARFWRTSDVL